MTQSGRGQATQPTVRISMNPTLIADLPLEVGIARGFFSDAGVHVVSSQYIQGSSDTQVGALQSGVLDITVVPSGPPLFNAFAHGAKLTLIASLNTTKAGYLDVGALVVRKAEWVSGRIRTLADLRGKRIDGGAADGPLDYFVRAVLAKAHLSVSQVRYTNHASGPASWLAMLKQNTEDVVAMTEPVATEAQQQGFGVRWISYKDVLPGHQWTFLATSNRFVAQHPQAVTRFLAGYLRAVRYMDASHGRWTPQLVQIESHWSHIPPAVIHEMGTVSYSRPNGTVNLSSIAAEEAFWRHLGVIKQVIPPASMVDAAPLKAALRELSATSGGGGSAAGA